MPRVDRKDLWKATLLRARALWNQGDVQGCWAHLERAHILSQPYAWPHVATHVEMFRMAWRTRDSKEGFGQLVRTIVAAPGSLLGRYPEGNTGRSNVSMFQPMPPPDDLLEPPAGYVEFR